jgi:hypothetical protein
MVEISRDGRRVYFTNSLYSPWDAQFYPDGIDGWMAKLDVGAGGRHHARPDFLVEFEEGHRPHQVRLEGGDAPPTPSATPDGHRPRCWAHGHAVRVGHGRGVERAG